jgi:hypothetical protein
VGAAEAEQPNKIALTIIPTKPLRIFIPPSLLNAANGVQANDNTVARATALRGVTSKMFNVMRVILVASELV